MGASRATALPRARGAGSGYYAWQTEQQRVVGPAMPARETALVEAFGVHKRRYGIHRLQVALRKKRHRVGSQRLCTVLARQGLRALQPKASPAHDQLSPRATLRPNLLLDQPTLTQTNRVRVSGITYLPLANNEWAYRYVFQDKCTEHVVG